jgi:CheY-like chemotaxis protein
MRLADTSLRLSVIDTGYGISTEQQAHLFEPFNRLGRENDTAEGAGIGLVITQRLVGLMGGELHVTSQIDHGSTFSVDLSVAAGPAGEGADETAGATTGIAAQSDHYTVLYVEDNPVNLKLVKQIFAPHRNIKLLPAHTGELGLDLARAHKPDLVVLDLNLPGMDGLQVLRQLRRDAGTRHIPAIALSANASVHDIERAMAVGFSEYITKPINVNKFIEAAYRHLGNSETNVP